MRVTDSASHTDISTIPIVFDIKTTQTNIFNVLPDSVLIFAVGIGFVIISYGIYRRTKN
jgi:hypothetical protein